MLGYCLRRLPGGQLQVGPAQLEAELLSVGDRGGLLEGDEGLHPVRGHVVQRVAQHDPRAELELEPRDQPVRLTRLGDLRRQLPSARRELVRLQVEGQ